MNDDEGDHKGEEEAREAAGIDLMQPHTSLWRIINRHQNMNNDTSNVNELCSEPKRNQRALLGFKEGKEKDTLPLV